MVHSIINYKDLGFKTAMSKAARLRVEEKENIQILKNWLSDETDLADYANGLDYFTQGKEAYIDR